MAARTRVPREQLCNNGKKAKQKEKKKKRRKAPRAGSGAAKRAWSVPPRVPGVILPVTPLSLLSEERAALPYSPAGGTGHGRVRVRALRRDFTTSFFFFCFFSFRHISSFFFFLFDLGIYATFVFSAFIWNIVPFVYVLIILLIVFSGGVFLFSSVFLWFFNLISLVFNLMLSGGGRTEGKAGKKREWERGTFREKKKQDILAHVRACGSSLFVRVMSTILMLGDFVFVFSMCFVFPLLCDRTIELGCACGCCEEEEEGLFPHYS